MDTSIEEQYQRLRSAVRPGTWTCTGCGCPQPESVLPTMFGERLTCGGCLNGLAENFQHDMPGTR